MAFFTRNLSYLQQRLRELRNAAHIPAQEEPFVWDWQARRDSYRRWDSMYENSAYLSARDGGLRETILEEIGELDESKPINGYFEPVAPIVDSYRQCLRGQLDRQLKIEVADTVTNADSLISAIRRIWRWSNFDEQKDVMAFYAANHGTVGLRVEAIGEGSAARIRMIPVPAGEIVDFDEDAQGNIRSVLLEYTVLRGALGGQRDEVTFREEIGKDRMVRYSDGKKVDSIENPIGVCPFVILRHRDVGREFGIPAHFGTEKQVHLINYLLTRFGLSVDRHVFANWFLTASGPPPTEMKIGDSHIAYTQTQPGDTKPTMEAVVANLDYAGMWPIVMGLIAHVRHRQPELTLSYLESLSGQSGETIAKLLLPFEDRVYAARARYERAVVNATRIGVSLGIRMGLWDVGSGVSSVNAANTAYQSGREDFAFNERPALPPTAYDRQKRAEADTKQLEITARAVKDLDGVVSQREKLRMLGYSDEDTARILAESRESDVLPQVAQ